MAIERRFGSLYFLLLVLVSAAVSGAVQNYFTGPAFFGLSGVVVCRVRLCVGGGQIGTRIALTYRKVFTMLLVGLVLWLY